LAPELPIERIEGDASVPDERTPRPDPARARATIDAAVRRLGAFRRALPEQAHVGRPGETFGSFNGKIGVVAMGVSVDAALDAAAHYPNVVAVVAFYGVGPAPRRSGLAVQAHFGARDDSIHSDARARFTASVERTGTQIRTIVHEDAGRGFIDFTRWESHRPRAATDAWREAIPFLRSALDVTSDGRPRSS
jgi:dienelactone hydrolase